MSEWIEYDGSDEQIRLIRSSVDGVIWKDSAGFMPNRTGTFFSLYTNTETRNFFRDRQIKYIFFCKRHHLADQIIQQAATGQPVWIRTKSPRDNNKLLTYKTSKPNWFLTDAEYSFEPFKDQS